MEGPRASNGVEQALDFLFWARWITAQISIGVVAYWILRLFALVK